jgi:drug/metabolite transporter (DMT)-like permease
VSQAVLFRSWAQFVMLGGWVLWRGAWPCLKTDRPWLHVARGLASCFAWWLYYYTFRNLDFALATVMSFTTSLFVVALSRLILGEVVRPVSWIATLVGFGGIAIASGLGLSAVQPAVLVGVFGGFFSAMVVFLNRSLAKTEDPMTIMTFIGLVVAAVATPVGLLDWQPISLRDSGLLLIAGVLGAFGMLCTIKAYTSGEPAALAPIPYLRIVFAIGVGYVFFSEIPALNTLVGAAIVIVCALGAAEVERRRRDALLRG